MTIFVAASMPIAKPFRPAKHIYSYPARSKTRDARKTNQNYESVRHGHEL